MNIAKTTSPSTDWFESVNKSVAFIFMTSAACEGESQQNHRRPQTWAITRRGPIIGAGEDLRPHFSVFVLLIDLIEWELEWRMGANYFVV